MCLHQRAFDASMPQAGFFASCYAQASNYSNFAFQVQMNILKGDSGGIIFRADPTNYKFYLFRVGQDGSYDLFLYVDNNGNHARSLSLAILPPFILGSIETTQSPSLRKMPTSISMNQQYIASVSDSSYGSGEIGLFADDHTNPTEVAFSNLQVWKL